MINKFFKKKGAILASTIVETKFGSFNVCYHKNNKYEVVSASIGDLNQTKPIVWFHSSCLFGEAFHAIDCDCGAQVAEAMKAIKENGSGVMVYSYQEGRGIGLLNKIKELELQKKEGLDTLEAARKLGFKTGDVRNYKAEIGALKDLGINQEILTFTGNPIKLKALKDAGFNVIKLLRTDDSMLTDIAKKERKTKVEKMGYNYW